MRKKILLLLVVLATFSFFSCTEDVSNQMSSDYPTDYDINYELRQVLQYDPMNIDGIDIVSKLDFFKTLRFTLHYENGKITKVKFNNGSVPFSPFNFTTTNEFEVECELDYDVFPNELRVRNTDHVIAYFENGEFVMPFQLECGSLSYKYTFKNIK
ncbi:hypothetical protein RDV77_09450 [Porphyromonadaceae sp. NP-X]|jgi:hypothetical protein|nr:hypothetical protein [Porphyromonadaceae sp. NP-X]NMB82830.1 hypothetical protein [Ignavibacteria bacterium]